MREIWAAGRQPLLVGGTMLYFHALLGGIAQLPEADPEVRAQIEARAAAGGWAALHEELRRADPAAAARIHVNDPQRIQRALEVYRVTGEPITRLQQSALRRLTTSRSSSLRFRPRIAPYLHARIETRFEAMWAAGFLDEVQRLQRKTHPQRGTSVDARGRISTVMEVPCRTLRLGRL